MKTWYLLVIYSFVIFSFTSCKKIKEIDQNPEIKPLRHGFKTSAAIGYCASLANRLFKGEMLPENVILQSKKKNSQSETGIMLVTINDAYPLPFNSSVGQITIAGIWNEEGGGIITALFTDIDIIEEKYEFIGIHTIPVVEMENGNLLTLFAEQDIVMGAGSDTLLHLNMGIAQISLELDRVKNPLPDDEFVAVQQNVWFINIDQNNTMSDVYDDEYTIHGGGQIAEITSVTGGVLYHAMIGAKIIYSTCDMNPVSGVGFIQNLKVGTETDLGHIFLNFHDRCDGKAYVEFATGKYLTSNHGNVNLNFY
jgi:hypothetical protein